MHKFDPAHAHRLEDPARLRWQDPEKLFQVLGIRQGAVCVDVGAGTGFFTLPLSALVGPEGRVYALDVSREMLTRLEARLGGNDAVIPVLSEESRLPLAEGMADLVLLVNVYHELADPEAVLAEAYRVLRPCGRLAIMDWQKREKAGDEPGPPPEHRVAREEVMRAAARAGFTVSMPGGADFPFHYLVVGHKAGG